MLRAVYSGYARENRIACQATDLRECTWYRNQPQSENRHRKVRNQLNRLQQTGQCSAEPSAAIANSRKLIPAHRFRVSAGPQPRPDRAGESIIPDRRRHELQQVCRRIPYGTGAPMAAGDRLRAALSGVQATRSQPIPASKSSAKAVCGSADAAPAGATVIGRDPGTDVAVLRLPSEELRRLRKRRTARYARGQVVLSIGRSRLGDLSASCGIIARTGSAWRTWRGGQIDYLIRPDVRLYVGQSGSALVDRQRRVIGINSPALARRAVITIPAQTDRLGSWMRFSARSVTCPVRFPGDRQVSIPVPEAVRSEFSRETGVALLVTPLNRKVPRRWRERWWAT